MITTRQRELFRFINDDPNSHLGYAGYAMPHESFARDEFHYLLSDIAQQVASHHVSVQTMVHPLSNRSSNRQRERFDSQQPPTGYQVASGAGAENSISEISSNDDGGDEVAAAEVSQDQDETFDSNNVAIPVVEPPERNSKYLQLRILAVANI